jgi:DNA-binding beta-propeller fold protein YncE
MSITSTYYWLVNDASTDKSRGMKRALRAVLSFVILLTALVGCLLAYLAYPGKPSPSKALSFDGFIRLPKSQFLTVLDYLTLTDHTLFVTSTSSGALYKINLDSTNVAASTVSEMTGAGEAHGVAILPGGKVAFITRSGANTVDVFDPGSLQQLGSIPVADDADAIHYLSSAHLVYVANGDAKLATLIDPEKRVTVGTIPLPGKPEFAALDPQTGLFYQNLEDANSLVAIDLGKKSFTGQWSLSPCEGPSGMAIDPRQRRLFSVCSGNATLVVFDLDTHRIITSLKTGSGPDSVAYDETLHRVYVAAKGGRLTVIQQDDPDTYRVLDQIRTHYGAHTLTVDPVSHKVYVAYASLFTHPRIAVFSPTM